MRSLLIGGLACGTLAAVLGAGVGFTDTRIQGALRPLRCERGARDCLDLRGLRDAGRAMDVSSDGGNVYVAGIDGGLAIMKRDRSTGRLRQLPGASGCLGPGRGCRHSRLYLPLDPVIVSRDGRNLYSSGGHDTVGEPGALLVFSRDRRTGALRQLTRRRACTTATGSHNCRTAELVLTRDGRSAYAVTGGEVRAFARDGDTGALTELPPKSGCVAGTRRARCQLGRGMNFPGALAVSRDGRDVYVGSDEGVSVLRRSPATGALTQLPGRGACVSTEPTSTTCASGRFGWIEQLAVSRGGHVVYGYSNSPNAIVVWHRNPSTGLLESLPGRDGCLSSDADIRCRRPPRALAGGVPIGFALSPFARNVYVAYVSGVRVSLGAVAVFGRTRDGALRLLPQPEACVGDVRRGCRRLSHSFGPGVLLVTPDGRHLIVGSDGLWVFRRSGIRSFAGPAAVLP